MTPDQRTRGQAVLAALGKAVCYLGLFLGWQMLVSTVYSVTIAVELGLADPSAMLGLDPSRYMEEVMAKLMEITLVSGLLTLGSVVLLFRLRGKSLRRELWLNPAPAKVFFWGAVLAWCLYLLVTLVMGLLPESWLENYGEASAGLEQTGAVAFLSTALVAPVVEEVIFRGLIYTRLQSAMPGWAAVALSAAIFGLCHGELLWFCYAYALGVIFAVVTRMTGSILPGMLMHVMFNSVNEVLVFFLADWEPGAFSGFLIFVLATAGTGLCALQLWRALTNVPAAAEQMEQAAPLNDRQELCRRHEVQEDRQARWDPDSGMNHRFPADKL